METTLIIPEDVIRVNGEVLTELPSDLYIPPSALRVFLELFEGPLDLLLYLIKKQNMDILNIPIAKITHQYVKYIELMQEVQLELAAEYLVMAAMLAEIKSRVLLPRPASSDESEGEDPRAELVRRLQEYERFATAAKQIDELPRLERETFVVDVLAPTFVQLEKEAPISIEDLMTALRDVMQRARLYTQHRVVAEQLSVRERMTIVLSRIQQATEFTEFSQFFTVEEGRMGVVVTLIAILELIRESVIELVQAEPFAPIYVRTKSELVEVSHE